MRALVALLTTLWALVPAGAGAGELCVTCMKPDLTYRCVFGENVAVSADDPKAQMLCISELAKFGHHESCAFDRRSATTCPGTLRAVSPPPKDAKLPPLQPPPIGPSGTPMPAPGAPKVDTGPRTVEELAKQTAQSTGIELDKAGAAVKGTAKAAGDGIGVVGDAAKKSWRCLASFFSDC